MPVFPEVAPALAPCRKAARPGHAVNYRPPYANPTLDAFARYAAKHLHPRTRMTADVKLGARPDGKNALGSATFLLQLGHERSGIRRRIAIQIGNPATLREHREQRRQDAALVAARSVDVVYRIHASNLEGSIEDALYLIAEWERVIGAGSLVSDLFSTRGRVNLSRAATSVARRTALSLKDDGVSIMLPTNDAGTLPFAGSLIIRRFDRRFPDWWKPHTRNMGEKIAM